MTPWPDEQKTRKVFQRALDVDAINTKLVTVYAQKLRNTIHGIYINAERMRILMETNPQFGRPEQAIQMNRKSEHKV